MLESMPDDTATVVAILKRPSDAERLLTEHTYHLPVHQLTRIAGCSLMAWYLPGWHATPHRIAYWGVVSRITVMSRQQYLPSQSNHPHAHHQYAIVHCDEIWPMVPALSSRRWRRITVHTTTWGALVRANDLGQLGHHKPPLTNNYGAAGQTRATKSAMSTII